MKDSYREIISCRSCGNKNLTHVISLGDLYVSNFLDSLEKESSGTAAPLDLVLCDVGNGGCGLLQLKHTVSQDLMYRNYWYRSGMNKTMTDELHSIAKKIETMVGLENGDYVIDIGSNDGTLLRGYGNPTINRIGFEPAKNLAKYGEIGTTKIFGDFFNKETWKEEFGEKKAKAITAIAMFYDLDDPNKFVSDVKSCLDKSGVFVIQMSYLPLMLRQNAFDNICHEHLEYYSLLSIEPLLDRNGLEVFDVEINDINGGSFRIYIRNKEADNTISRFTFGVNDERVEAMRAREKELGLNQARVYMEFAKRVDGIKRNLVDFLKEEISFGKKIYVYGASTKGNTLLQYFNLDNRIITAAVERNKEKWGRVTVATNIPIISEEQGRKESPDYFLVLPWHFLREFMQREIEFLKKGGKFIVPLPEFKIIGMDDL